MALARISSPSRISIWPPSIHQKSPLTGWATFRPLPSTATPVTNCILTGTPPLSAWIISREKTREAAAGPACFRVHLAHIRLRDFRNYARLDVDFAPGFHLLLGSNAQGKT